MERDVWGEWRESEPERTPVHPFLRVTVAPAHSKSENVGVPLCQVSSIFEYFVSSVLTLSPSLSPIFSPLYSLGKANEISGSIVLSSPSKRNSPVALFGTRYGR
eukprot:scaffold212448_cov31-Tisochrysis_lutea.AAC.1